MNYAKMFSNKDGNKAMIEELNLYLQSKPMLQVLAMTNIDEHHIVVIFNSIQGV